MDYTDDEIADAARDLIALLRADLGDDRDGVDAIVGAATGREASAVIRTLVSSLGDMLVRLTAAAALVHDEPALTAVLGDDRDALMAAPALRAAVMRNIAGVQAGLLGES